ncbi:MAG: DUF1761 domain-containing protein [Bacteroidota bacterium]
MPENFYMFFIAAFIPMIVGAIYYHEKVVGGVWMRTNGFKASDLEGGNMAVILGSAYLLSVVGALALSGLVIHQGHVTQIMIPEVFESGSATQQQFNDFMAQYGNRYRTFGHGFLHGSILSIFFVLPIIGINALFERRGWKYIFIHVGYWFITLGLMGGLLCQTLTYAPLT